MVGLMNSFHKINNKNSKKNMKEIRTKQELDEILSSENNKKIFIRVHADWCAPCKQQTMLLSLNL